MKKLIFLLLAFSWITSSAQRRFSYGSIHNYYEGYGVTSTATAAGTSTLTKLSSPEQIFTGTSTQTVVLPDATTLLKGWQFRIHNQSTGAVTVNTNGGSALHIIAAGLDAVFVVQDTSSAAGTWDINYQGVLVSSGAKITATNNITGPGYDFTMGDRNNRVNELLGSPIVAETFNLPLVMANTSTALVDNTVRFVAVYLDRAKTLTGIKVYSVTAGSYTGDNNNRVGLYTYSGGTLTLVASSTNSASLWTATANTVQTIAFSSTYAAQPGLYFVGLLYNQSAQTTAPSLAGGTALGNLSRAALDYTNSAKVFGTLGTSNDLPSSQAMSGITGVTASYWVGLY